MMYSIWNTRENKRFNRPFKHIRKFYLGEDKEEDQVDDWRVTDFPTFA